MIKKIRFREEDVPYGVLEPFGLNREMVEDLPERALRDILQGRRSPSLPLSMVDSEGKRATCYARFALRPGEAGQVHVVFYPELREAAVDRFDTEQRQALLDGFAIADSIDGVESFVQLDPETKQLLYVPVPVMARNIQIVTDIWELSAPEQKCLLKGVPVSVMEGDEILTVGVDLMEEIGLRLAEGNIERWRSEARKDIFKETFGLNGCWRINGQGNLYYTREEEYTDALLAEQRKVIERRSEVKR